ncbi:AgrD family cyclic lactone autoinducer peptide [Listeria welshimeri]|nr:cyclic lactone autoinducer peptide [Listeria welshimeri]MBF2483829.1 cyclic lactone autoinducer peptide [Listeria welshimeri]
MEIKMKKIFFRFLGYLTIILTFFVVNEPCVWIIHERKKPKEIKKYKIF